MIGPETMVPSSLAPYVDRWRAGCRNGIAPRLAIATAMPHFRALPPRLRAASISEWSMYYFGALIIPAVTMSVTSGHTVPAGIDDVDCDIDDAGRVFSFEPRADHERADSKDSRSARGALVDGHIAPMIEACRQQGGLSPRVLWSNAAVILDYVVGELQAHAVDPHALREAEDLLTGQGDSRLSFPFRTRKNCRQRRVCCLRFRLSNATVCPDICPRDA